VKVLTVNRYSVPNVDLQCRKHLAWLHGCWVFIFAFLQTALNRGTYKHNWRITQKADVCWHILWYLPAVICHQNCRRRSTIWRWTLAQWRSGVMCVRWKCSETILHALTCELLTDRSLYIKPLSHWKLISKFMLVCFFRNKISSVNGQLSKEINFEILFRNLEHVLFCGRNFAYGALWLVCRQCLQASIYTIDDVVFWKFMKNFEIFISKYNFKINF